MKMRRIITIIGIVAVVVSGMFGDAGSASAATVAELQSQIAKLMVQIKALQAQIDQTQGTTEQAWCHDFNTNLRFGDTGLEILALQNALGKIGFPVRDIEENGQGQNAFGEFTASGVVGFQEKYKDEILTPVGLQRGTGFVGKGTRAKLNALYGCSVSTIHPDPVTPPVTVNPAPIPMPVLGLVRIVSLSPSAGPVGTIVTMTGYGFTKTGNKIKFGNLGSENNPIYSVNSADGNTIVFKVPSGNYLACWYANSRCLAVAYATEPGAYKVSVANANGESDSLVFTVTEKTTLKPSITVLSPNGGEQFSQGIGSIIKWSSRGTDPINIDLLDYGSQQKDGSTPFASNIVTNHPSMKGALVWNIPLDGSVGVGKLYKIRITTFLDNVVQDMSDNYFSIVPAPNITPSITVSSLNPNGETLQKGATGYVNMKFSPSVPLGGFVINLINANTDDVIAHLKFCGLDNVIQDSVVPPNVTWQWKVGYDANGKEISDGSYRILVYSCGSKIDNVWINTIVSSASNVFSIVSTTTTQPSITVLSPNGGNHFEAGQTYDITWKFLGSTDKIVQIVLVGGPNMDGSIIANVGASMQQYSWTVPTTVIPRNDYRIILRESSLDYAILDSSNNDFEIVSNSSPSIGVTVSVNGSHSPVKVAYNSPVTVSWTSTNAVSCSAYGAFIPMVGGGLWTDFSYNLPTLGSKTLYARHNTLALSSLEIGVQCFDSMRNSNGDLVKLLVDLPTTTIKPSVDLKVNASDGPVTLAKGGNAGLIAWEAKGVDSCVASLGGAYDLNGDGYVNINDVTLYTSKNPGATAETDLLLKEIARTIGTFGGSYDINGDGLVTGLDISMFSKYNLFATVENNPFLSGMIKAYGIVYKSGNINSDTNLSWNGEQVLSGNASTGTMHTGQTLVLSCIGDQGTVMDSVEVIVK